ncbi:uncharacterized protein [Haliotis asinina]|uniref:uncharacterized protein n=1 Tax=Haliotis asinina TaxID=109174 RepID=UPI00353264DC
MTTILKAVAYLCALSTTLQANDDDCVHPPVQEVIPGKSQDSIRSVFAPSVYDCAAECKLSPLCLFFTFDAEKRTCELLKKRNQRFAVDSGIFHSSRVENSFLQQRKEMSVILLTAACSCALPSTLQASDNDCVHPTVQEVLPVKSSDYIRSVIAPSMYDCAAECKLSRLCLFFTFDPKKRTCQLLKKRNQRFTVGSGIFFSSIQKWKMPLTGACRNASCSPVSQCTVGRNGHPLCLNDALIGMKCTRDNDCHVNMTSCFRGRCLCHPGYSHNIRRNSCDRDCQNYGDTMTPYIGISIRGHNTKILNWTSTMEMCMSACVQQTLLCKTIEFRRKPPKCQLSRMGYLDVTNEERLKGLQVWWFAVRKCQD